MDDEADIILQTPLTFAKVLETWISMHCTTCGRGEHVVVPNKQNDWLPLSSSSQNGTHRSRSVAKKKRHHQSMDEEGCDKLFETWVGAFCTRCGRGGHQLGDGGTDTRDSANARSPHVHHRGTQQSSSSSSS